MAKLEVLTYPNPLLKKHAEPVKGVTPELRQLAADMLETMYAAPGVGLAANQVGVLQRMIVIDTRPRDEDGRPTDEGMTELEKAVTYPLVLINPEVVAKEGTTTYDEGCLSVPGYVETVVRSNVIEVKAMNLDGQSFRFKADGLLGICVQHEIDHLDGRLFIDRLSAIRRNLIKSRIKKHGYSQKTEEHVSRL